MWRFPRWTRNTRIQDDLITILANQCTIQSNQSKLMTGLTDLQTAIANLTTTTNNVVTYLQGLPAMILALQNAQDPDAAVAALAQQVASDTANLTSALQAAPTSATPAPAATPPSGTTPTP